MNKIRLVVIAGVLAAALAVPAHAVLFDVVNLGAADELPVWCPTGYAVRLRDWNERPNGRKGVVYCVPAVDHLNSPILVDPLESPFRPPAHPSPTGSFATPTPTPVRPEASDGITDTLLVPIGDARSTPTGPGWRR